MRCPHDVHHSPFCWISVGETATAAKPKKPVYGKKKKKNEPQQAKQQEDAAKEAEKGMMT